MNYSKTFVGIIMLLAGPQLAKYGIADAELAKFFELGSAVVGFLLAWWGRKTAAKPVTWMGTYQEQPKPETKPDETV